MTHYSLLESVSGCKPFCDVIKSHFDPSARCHVAGHQCRIISIVLFDPDKLMLKGRIGAQTGTKK